MPLYDQTWDIVYAKKLPAMILFFNENAKSKEALKIINEEFTKIVKEKILIYLCHI